MTLKKTRPSQLDPTNKFLLLRAAAKAVDSFAASGISLESSTPDKFLQWTQEQGIGFATAAYYYYLKNKPLNFAFHSSLAGATKADYLDAEVLIVSSLVPELGDWQNHWEDLRRNLRGRFAEITMIETKPLASLLENATRIADALSVPSMRRRILVSRSRGSSEVELLRARRPELFEDVELWLNIQGLVGGCEVYNNMSWWQRFRAWTKYTSCGQNFSVTKWWQHWPKQPPTDLLTVNLVGCPFADDLQGREFRQAGLQASYRRLARTAPNDGLALLWQLHTQGIVVPFLGLAHNFKLALVMPTIDKILHRVLVKDRSQIRIHTQVVDRGL